MRGAFGLLRRIATGGRDLRGYLAMAVREWDARPAGTCPCCGHAGRFRPEPHMAMAKSCPGCGSLERQRLFALALQRGFMTFAGAEVLHFAPDPAIARLVAAQAPARQSSADAAAGRAERVLDIQAIAMPDRSVDRVICLHVLEHVDDRRALAELFRILRPGGQAVIMVPVAEGWSETYENPAVNSERERAAHFGQADHVRYYGADVRGRIAEAGFALSEFTASGEDAARYLLARGERVFLASKP